MSVKKEEVVSLRQQLQDAEIDAALSEAAATMDTVTPGKGTCTRLGRVLTVEVELEGTPVKALLDTGSPVTIVSLKFLMDALSRQRQSGQDPAEWRASVERRLKPTNLTLRDHGGSEVPLVREVELSLKRESFVTTATIQVQAAAPVDLLLGTDTQSQLGFMFLASNASGTTEELLKGGRWNTTIVEESSPTGESESAPTDETFGILAQLSAEVTPKGGDPSLSDQQRSDPELWEVIDFLTDGVLPKDDTRARELALTRPQFVIQDEVLYYIAKDKSLRVIPPSSVREKLFHDAHGGPYGAHLREVKIHSQLAKQGKAYKFARTFHGPFRVKDVVDTGVLAL